MCGRFTLILDPGDLQEELDLGGIPEEYKPRYNIAPTQDVAVVRDNKAKQVELFKWGLIPSWAKDTTIGTRLINARSETIQEKPSFKSPFARRRNLILTSGFYEWRMQGGTKMPVFIYLNAQKVFAFAALWEEWLSPDGNRILSTTIITCPANDLIGEFHDRMPVILDKKSMWKWIDPNRSLHEAQQLLAPYPADRMSLYTVSAEVNSPKSDHPGLIKPIPQLF